MQVDRQEADCRELAARLGWPVADRYVWRDPSISAWDRRRRRPGWEAMLTALGTDDIDAIVIWVGDRLIRQPYDLERLLGIADSRGIRLASIAGVRNLDSPDDRFILRIEAAQACKESDNTSRRVRRAVKARAARGLPVGGGKRPFGFEPDSATRRESECEVLATAVARLLEGHSQASVLRWMNTVSTTSQGNRWSQKSLRNILERPRIIGLIEHEGVLSEAAWDPIISREQYEDLQLLFAQKREEHPHPGQERRYMLTGWAACKNGHTAVTKPSGGRNRKTSRIYWCRESGCTASFGRNVELLDAYVTGRVLRLLNEPGFISEVMQDGPSVAPEIAALELRKRAAAEQFANLVDHPNIDPGLLARSMAGFDKRIAELRNEHAMSARRRLLARMAGIDAERWEELPIDVRADVVRATYRITVLPTTRRGPGFDVDAVDLERVPLD